jgi:hypothetical protein
MNSEFRVLINGCSFTRGPISWPYHLKTIHQTGFTNLALSSAGNTYIHESTVAELAKRSYQGVIVMWSGLTRVDTRVAYPEYFTDTVYTSEYQHKTNDWPEKIVEPIDDATFIDRSWVFGLGHVNQDRTIFSSKLFEGTYKYMESSQFAFHLLVKIISLQCTLKSLHIPYIFTLYQPYQDILKEHKDLAKLVDWDSFFIDENIYEIANRNKDLDKDGHPGVKSNKQWADLLDKEIERKILGLL